jgi:hypothetical protein
MVEPSSKVDIVAAEFVPLVHVVVFAAATAETIGNEAMMEQKKMMTLKLKMNLMSLMKKNGKMRKMRKLKLEET